MFFFFQAEDGIRDYKVTGVQTCALPICSGHRRVRHADQGARRRARPGAQGHALGGPRVHDQRPGRLQVQRRPGALKPQSVRTRGALAETSVPDGASVQLAERLAEAVGRLPRAADRAELEQLLGMLESRAVNLALAGIPRPFTAMSPPQRERYLAGWATSRLGLRRRAFQALKRLATVLYYTATDTAGQSPVWADIKYPGPLGPPPPTPKRLQPLAVTGDTKLECAVVVIGSGAGG